MSSVCYNDIMELKKRGDEVSPRTGRPKIDNPKCIDIKVRIDKELNTQLLSYCKNKGITRAEAVRQGIINILEK